MHVQSADIANVQWTRFLSLRDKRSLLSGWTRHRRDTEDNGFVIVGQRTVEVLTPSPLVCCHGSRDVGESGSFTSDLGS